VTSAAGLSTEAASLKQKVDHSLRVAAA